MLHQNGEAGPSREVGSTSSLQRCLSSSPPVPRLGMEHPHLGRGGWTWGGFGALQKWKRVETEPGVLVDLLRGARPCWEPAPQPFGHRAMLRPVFTASWWVLSPHFTEE